MRTLALAVFAFTWHAGAGAIHTKEAVQIGGIRQWITINGADERNPVFLFLHGGPGNSAIPYSSFTDSLQEKFIVVQWDQRETGKTLALNPSPEPLTVARFEADAAELIQYLTGRFKKQKIYLMGHSWGGFLGLLVAAHHPELIEAYFAISPMIWQAESERLALDMMKKEAAAAHNDDEARELGEVHLPFRSGTELFYDRKWLARRLGQKGPSQAFVEQWSVRWLALFNQALEFNFFTEAPVLKCPVFFLAGDNDYQTNFNLTRSYYERVSAPRKDFFWFPGDAHTFLAARQKKIQEIVLRELRDASN